MNHEGQEGCEWKHIGTQVPTVTSRPICSKRKVSLSSTKEEAEILALNMCQIDSQKKKENKWG